MLSPLRHPPFGVSLLQVFAELWEKQFGVIILVFTSYQLPPFFDFSVDTYRLEDTLNIIVLPLTKILYFALN